MAEPIILASSSSGRVELVRGRGTQVALDAKFIPAQPAPTDERAWTSYVAWAVKDDADDAWQLSVTPDFVTRGGPRQLPALKANSEPAARAWLELLAHTWLQLVDDTRKGEPTTGTTHLAVMLHR